MRGRLGVVVTSRSCRVVYIAFFWVAAAAIGVWTSQCGMLRGATGRANSAGLSVTRKSRNALGWEVYKYPSIFSQIAISKVVLFTIRSTRHRQIFRPLHQQFPSNFYALQHNHQHACLVCASTTIPLRNPPVRYDYSQ